MNRPAQVYRSQKVVGRSMASVLVSLMFFVPLFGFVFSSRAIAATTTVDLGTTDNFGVLGGSAISDTGTSSITGDVGLDPTGGASITGLTCAEVTGTIYDNDAGYTGGGGGSTACLETNGPLLTTAKNDLITAYDDAAGRTTTSTVDTELGGTTLTDGVYDSAAGTFGITGTLTLDGGGNADSVFIFKMASTLTTASSSEVVLTNGAQACNVFWQVGSSATLGTSTTFVGNILALTSITDDGGGNVNGRLLARNGATTLNNTTLAISTCAVAASSTSSSSTGSGGSTAATPDKVCPPLNYTSPIIIDSRRVDPDSVYISWGPYSGTNAFIVQYGLENGSWLYSTSVTGFSTTINALPANQPIWVRVAATDNCSVGTYGEARLVGGPRLPNTGVDSGKDHTAWYIAAGMLIFSPLMLRVIRVWYKK